MTATYDRLGLRFQYPENWTVADDATGDTPRTIVIQSPSGAFWSVDVYPFSKQAADVLEETLQALHKEYSDLETHAASEEIAGEKAAGFDLYFHCLDFIVTARLRCLRHGHATYMLTYQAEDREFEELEPVFRAMTYSMFQED